MYIQFREVISVNIIMHKLGVLTRRVYYIRTVVRWVWSVAVSWSVEQCLLHLTCCLEPVCVVCVCVCVCVGVCVCVCVCVCVRTTKTDERTCM